MATKNTKARPLLTYKEVLKRIGENKSNLLLGNGFNNSLGVNTSYENIFKEMFKDYPVYKDIELDIQNYNYDLEKMLIVLSQTISKNKNSEFLQKVIKDKVKFDFMKSASKIVCSKIKNIYQENNKNIWLMLKNFNNYFTLNFDPFLYLLLMRFKKPVEDESRETGQQKTVAIQATLKFTSEELDESKNNIYQKIKNAREKGTQMVELGDLKSYKSLGKARKAELAMMVKNLFSTENWSNKDIEKAIKLVLKNEQCTQKNEMQLSLDDGFRSEKNGNNLIFNKAFNPDQNLFFLHGAFHLYSKDGCLYKIKQSNYQALYQRLTKIIDNEEENILTVFGGENKISEIESNDYLKHCYEQLGQISGSVVILGCSLDENDKHIFEQINKSAVETVYISASESSHARQREKAGELLKNKEVLFFDYTTISYAKPND